MVWRRLRSIQSFASLLTACQEPEKGSKTQERINRALWDYIGEQRPLLEAIED